MPPPPPPPLCKGLAPGSPPSRCPPPEAATALRASSVGLLGTGQRSARPHAPPVILSAREDGSKAPTATPCAPSGISQRVPSASVPFLEAGPWPVRGWQTVRGQRVRGWRDGHSASRRVPPPPLYKLRPCQSYSRRRDCINLGPNFNSVPNIVQPHKTWV